MLLNWTTREKLHKDIELIEPAPGGSAPSGEQRKSARAASNGGGSAIPAFHERPPWLGADLQTLRNFLCGGPSDLLGGERLLLPMRDGDMLAARLDLPAQSRAQPLVVLIHGVAGSEASVNIVTTARRLVASGWPVLRLNLRGSPPSRPTCAGRYHGGRTEDLAEALRRLPARLTRHGVFLVGHSLGGGLVVKFMGESRRNLPLLGAVAVSAPLDFAATCARMMTARNFAYQKYVLDALKREALAPGAALTSAEKSLVAEARNVFEFDDRFVAPHFGYRDAPHYYEENEPRRFLAGIRRPTLIVHALDDPWIPGESYEAIDWRRLPRIETALSPGGGHLGFHGRGSSIAWHDRVTIGWLEAHLHKN
ncbi:YheT family hydrolase [Methylocystis heyeri]|uniref:Alpha/beta fold hydrolase n=1 Tax=Methylocystis heyeri TaxID=391905 RepID=A0A6B8KI56_9HYPH|nr:alpha/beta fold hydrolase [Methylocystis heyeri]QGM47322.1 alpha/beta fold hydrolase [Methylocystis heyeri]